MREATFSMFHRFTRVDLDFFCFLFVWLGVWLGFWLFLPRFRDLSSSFAKSNDRRSCHGAHGMGEKKSSGEFPTKLAVIEWEVEGVDEMESWLRIRSPGSLLLTSCVNSNVFLVMSWCGSATILLNDCVRCLHRMNNS